MPKNLLSLLDYKTLQAEKELEALKGCNLFQHSLANLGLKKLVDEQILGIYNDYVYIKSRGFRNILKVHYKVMLKFIYDADVISRLFGIKSKKELLESLRDTLMLNVLTDHLLNLIIKEEEKCMKIFKTIDAEEIREILIQSALLFTNENDDDYNYMLTIFCVVLFWYAYPMNPEQILV